MRHLYRAHDYPAHHEYLRQGRRRGVAASDAVDVLLHEFLLLQGRVLQQGSPPAHSSLPTGPCAPTVGALFLLGTDRQHRLFRLSAQAARPLPQPD